MNTEPQTQFIELSARRMFGDIKEFAGREPGKAVAAAFGVGLLINLLPTRVMVGAATAVGALLLRPVLMTLGITKAMELCCAKSQTTTPITLHS